MDKQPQAPIDDAVLPRFPLTDDPDKKSSGGDGGTACDGQSAQPRSMKVAMEGDNTQVTMDLLHSVKGLYRLLEVVHEKGSGGIVDKFKIVQDSIARFANHVQPGSYRSQTQIDFHALDTQNIKPLGLYGSISSIVDFLYKLGRIDLEVQAFLTAPRDEQSGVTRPALRPGLYLLDANDCEPGLVFVIFWPEDGTWLDGFRSSVSRNRVTFMRYLTKLCDQIVCLVSDEHSENLIWKDNEEHRDEDDVEEPGSLDAFDRVYTFSVEQTNEEEESIATKEGFTLTHPSIRVEPVDKPELQAILQTQLIVGETAQALFQVRYVPSRTDTTEIDETMWPRALGSELSTKIYPNLHISDTVDREGLRILLDNGLKGRLGNLEQDWQSQKTRDINKLQDDKKKQRSKELEVIKARVQTLKSSLPLYIVARILELFPILKTHRKELICAAMGRKVDQDIESDLDLESEKATLMQNHIEIVEPKLQVIDSQIRILESHKKERYDTLKRRIRRVEDAIQNGNNLTDSDVQNLVDLIQKKKDWTEQFLAITRPDKGEGTNSVIETFTNVLNTAVETVKSTVDAVKSTVGSSTKTDKKPLPTLPALDDVTFAAIAEDLIASRPVLGDAVAELKEQMVAAFTKKLTDFKSIPHDIGKSLQDAMDSQLNEEFRNREDEEERLAWESLRQQIHAHLATQIVDGGPSFHIQHVSKETKWGYGPFRVRGTISSPTKEGLVHTIIPLETREEDSRKSAEDRSYIFRPVVRQNLPSNFMLPVTSTIKYTRLVGQDRCLMVIRDGPDYKIFLDMINHLAHTIEVGGQSRKLTLERTGEHPRFALDETKRLFAVVATHHGSLNLHVFSYDNDTNNISMRGGVTNLTKWWPSGSPTISHIVFISGMEELLLVEEGGDARIFSLLTENFRPTSIKLEGCVTAAFSSADGACLLVIINSALDDPEAKHLRIKCFHWASFGTNEGHEIEWPEGCSKTSQVSVSSVGHRYASHLLFMDVEKGHCHSLLLQITCKSSEFAFRSSRKGDVANRSSNTVNNSLIDCHAEVWTRYPVYPVIKRETTESAVHHPRVILFVSTSPATRFPPYFANLIRQFELKSRKPTKGSLKRIRINATKEWDPFLHELPVSDLQLGDWLVGLFCLIPIHLAVTGSNRFIPLKDGVQDPVFERSLLGADVAQISELISLGWYESIFSSYSAKKPVKVVTSMGEQSVGKSFALNHFVDTSFAGSAMRCTEGVWLSVTPTRDYLLVAMDFEGVHSIERSAQEDTLLVLLNAAISNFVIFRNNFALSRDIAGLFTSFQSSATVLDPAVNPQLFNSTLSIIIKDVIDSDAQEIVNEFQQKFQRIVQQERGDNFISKLHKGKLDIIPWPVIESSRFYELFAALKIRLDRQAVTHHHAATFLSTLKMLMAKLKANDWGALDQNLAIQRANQLFVHLACALAFGVIDPVNGEPLKNLETDEVLDMRSGDLELFIDSAATLVDVETYTKPQCLEKMRKRFPKLGSRYRMAETDFVELLRGYINEVIEQRINDVRNWLTTNTMRFGERPEISTLFREFDGLSRELRLAALICGSKCSSCGLLCLQDNQHKGDHDCRTSHKCGHICDFNDNHESLDVPDCGMPAGHDGRHICKPDIHLCGLVCHLNARDGCLNACSKRTGHSDDEPHACAAMVHACGDPCELIKAVDSDGKAICDRRCVLDCKRPHDRHCCDRPLTCPVKCQLCNSFCSSGDHFHALNEQAVHLCGQSHACGHKCQHPGICDIATSPQSIESTFNGKHSVYQFTKYTQEARRLPCVIPIEAGRVAHDGDHTHSLDLNAFHHCERTCTQCGYYCTLPLGHRQHEHETSHGSMAFTEWVVDGDDDATFELEGHKYATGDNGAPMLCSMVCKSLGRHTHIDACRAENEASCRTPGTQHKVGKGKSTKQDWVTHRLFWARSGFKDPYTNREQAEFDLCDRRCAGDEHDSNINPGAVVSYCTLPMFHPLANPAQTPALGHVSQDGHAYNCKNPALMQRSYHIFFVLDKSGSMSGYDRQPLEHTPAAQRISRVANNRWGAVMSSLYSFWTARDAAVRSGAAIGVRRDAYSIITFSSMASTMLSNDTAKSPDELLDVLLSQSRASGGTNFNHALQVAQEQMTQTWATERSPVIIFLSDGECDISDQIVNDLCHAAVRLGKPLSLHSVSFGKDVHSHSLRRMSTIANQVYASAPRDPLMVPMGNPCSFSEAIDTINLTNTFLSIAESLKNPRAALSRVPHV